MYFPFEFKHVFFLCDLLSIISTVGQIVQTHGPRWLQRRRQIVKHRLKSLAPIHKFMSINFVVFF